MSRLNCAADKSTVRALCSVFSTCWKQHPPLSRLPTPDFIPEGEHSVRVDHACQGEQSGAANSKLRRSRTHPPAGCRPTPGRTVKEIMYSLRFSTHVCLPLCQALGYASGRKL